MSFQAKRLTAQLPTGESVAFEVGGGGEKAAAAAFDQKIVKGVCIDLSQHEASCLDEMTWYLVVAMAAAFDSSRLPDLRKQLEAQLKKVSEFEAAER